MIVSDLTSPVFYQVLAVFIFIFGMLWGSFLNVCIYRIPIEKSIVFPPSSCPVCGHKIKWYENIPVVSYLFLLGRCSSCKTRISPIYPIVELLTGFLFMMVYIYYGLNWGLPLLWFFVSAMIVTSGVDIKIQIIPDSISLPGIALGLLYGYISPDARFIESVIGAFAGGGSLMLVILVFYIVTRKIGLGFGDVKLLAMIGAFIGPWKLAPVLFLASVMGIAFFFFAKIVLKWTVLAKEITAEDIKSTPADLQNVIYFGPFLALAGIVFLFITNDDLINLLRF